VERRELEVGRDQRGDAMRVREATVAVRVGEATTACGSRGGDGGGRGVAAEVGSRSSSRPSNPDLPMGEGGCRRPSEVAEETGAAGRSAGWRRWGRNLEEEMGGRAGRGGLQETVGTGELRK
jgi:hypothetical protein